MKNDPIDTNGNGNGNGSKKEGIFRQIIVYILCASVVALGAFCWDINGSVIHISDTKASNVENIGEHNAIKMEVQHLADQQKAILDALNDHKQMLLNIEHKLDSQKPLAATK